MREERAGEVRELDTDHDQHVGILDRRAYRLRTDRADIGTDVGGEALVDDPSSPEERGDRQPVREEALQFAPRTHPLDQDVGEH